MHVDDPDHPVRRSPTAPCGCEWDSWHCPHCGSVTATSGDAWEPAHTLPCHRRAEAIAAEGDHGGPKAAAPHAGASRHGVASDGASGGDPAQDAEERLRSGSVEKRREAGDDVDVAIAEQLEELPDRLRARFVDSGVPYYVEGDDDGRVVYRDVRTDAEWTPEEVQRWHDSRGAR